MDDFPGLDTIRQRVGDVGQQHHPALRSRAQHNDALEFPLQRIGDGLGIIAIRLAKVSRDNRHTGDRPGLGQKLPGRASRLALPEGLQLFLQFLDLAERHLDLFFNLADRRI